MPGTSIPAFLVMVVCSSGLRSLRMLKAGDHLSAVDEAHNELMEAMDSLAQPNMPSDLSSDDAELLDWMTDTEQEEDDEDEPVPPPPKLMKPNSVFKEMNFETRDNTKDWDNPADIVDEPHNKDYVKPQESVALRAAKARTRVRTTNADEVIHEVLPRANFRRASFSTVEQKEDVVDLKKRDSDEDTFDPVQVLEGVLRQRDEMRRADLKNKHRFGPNLAPTVSGSLTVEELVKRIGHVNHQKIPLRLPEPKGKNFMLFMK